MTLFIGLYAEAYAKPVSVWRSLLNIDLLQCFGASDKKLNTSTAFSAVLQVVEPHTYLPYLQQKNL